MNLSPLVVGLAIGGATLVGYLLHGSARSKEPPAATSADELEQLKGRVQELERAASANQSRPFPGAPPNAPMSVPAAPASQDSLQQAAPTTRPGLSPEEMADLEVRRKQRFGELLDSEPRDRSWAPDYEASLRDAVQATATAHGDRAPEIGSLTCRTTICRLELTSPSLASQQRFMGDLHDQLPPMAAVHFTTAAGADGESKVTLDFVRAGYPTGAIDGPFE